MSKSLGNVVAPQKVMSTLGADVLRLWVAATDYANEMSVSDEILKRMADSYRRMRNTVRFLLGNLHGFDPARHAVRRRSWWRSIAGRSRARAQLQEEVVAAYRDYEFHVDLSEGAQLLRRRPGRLLSRRAQGSAVHDAGGQPRRAARRRPRCITSRESMVRWLAPILSFTAEEIWQLPAGQARRSRCSSTTWHALPEVPRDEHRLGRADRAARRRAARAGEAARGGHDRRAARSGGGRVLPRRRAARASTRSARSCGSCSSLPRRACITVDAAPPMRWRLRGLHDGVCDRGDARREAAKCVRCWHRRPDVGQRSPSIRSCARAASRTSPRPGENAEVTHERP